MVQHEAEVSEDSWESCDEEEDDDGSFDEDEVSSDYEESEAISHDQSFSVDSEASS